MPYAESTIRSTCPANVGCGSHEFHEIRESRETQLCESRETHLSPSRGVTREEFAFPEVHRLHMDHGWPKRSGRRLAGREDRCETCRQRVARSRDLRSSDELRGGEVMHRRRG